MKKERIVYFKTIYNNRLINNSIKLYELYFLTIKLNFISIEIDIFTNNYNKYYIFNNKSISLKIYY